MKKFIKEYWIPILIGGTCTPMIRYAEKSYGEENKWFLWLGFCLLILLYIIISERAKAKKTSNEKANTINNIRYENTSSYTYNCFYLLSFK